MTSSKKHPWEKPNEHGELPGDLCCQRSTGKFCYEHDPVNYLCKPPITKDDFDTMILDIMHVVFEYNVGELPGKFYDRFEACIKEEIEILLSKRMKIEPKQKG